MGGWGGVLDLALAWYGYSSGILLSSNMVRKKRRRIVRQVICIALVVLSFFVYNFSLSSVDVKVI